MSADLFKARAPRATGAEAEKPKGTTAMASEPADKENWAAAAASGSAAR